MSDKKAVVLFSGGLDSVTTLAIAQSHGYACHAVSFHYGQRHSAELNAAQKLAETMQVAKHHIVNLDLSSFNTSSLTNHALTIPAESTEGIPTTYVPARNTIFLSIALGWAEVLNAQAIYLGVNAVDYSGYPDCRPEFIDAFQHVCNLATKSTVEGAQIRICTPLIHLTKAEIIMLGIKHGVDYARTVSCYQATEDGRACGHCDSCRLRAQGFEQAGVEDPTRYL